jgi:hypothetical protein
VDEVIKENKELRKLLWINHGCSISDLYGDDGEMQCHRCKLDFKRDSIKKVERIFQMRVEKELFEHDLKGD